MPQPDRIKLPIDPHLPQILAHLKAGPNLVLQASPGSGKTTRVPPALLRSDVLPAQSEILVLEPRRLAAKWAARRVADELGGRVGELGGRVGEEVGYQFRFENVTSPRTRLRFLTEGMLMRRMLSDPELRRVSAVVLDEFHERHLHGDLALAYLRWLQRTKRPELRIIVMSATLDTESLRGYLGDCPIVNVETRVHPITIEHLRTAPAKYLDQTVKDSVVSVLNRDESGDGHILVFLPGMSEIRRSQEALRPIAENRGITIAPLHGELTREEQDDAIISSKRRKIILATNVAETSLTIEGVTAVIDSGQHRVASYSWWSGVPSLKTRPISQASAIQRAGRAGRTGPGFCLRLYTREDFITRPQFQTPELRRADLTQTVLELRSLGVRDLRDFPWFEPPEASLLEAAEKLLVRLGAVDISNGELTELGRRMKETPTHPRIARSLLEAEKNGSLREAVRLAALLSEGELEGINALEAVERSQRQPSGMQKIESQLLSFYEKSATKHDPEMKNLSFAFLCGFPDRVAKRRGQELLLASGGSAKLPEGRIDSWPGGDELFVALDLQETQRSGQQRSQLQARSLIPIAPEWLFDLVPSAVEERDELKWDPEKRRITGVSRLIYDDLVLSESPIREVDPAARANLLCKMAFGFEFTALEKMTAESIAQAITPPESSEEFEATSVRLKLFAEGAKSEMAIDGKFFRGLFELALGSLSSLEQVRDVSWGEAVSNYLETVQPGSSPQLNSWAPASFELPNGRRVKIHYRFGKPPWIESPLQHFFGVKQPPTVARGRVALTLHLLAPNQRALQVTSDLPGFWARTYPEIRKELSRRYPRWTWPDDPTVAPPVRR